MDFLFKIRGCGLYSGALYSPEFTVIWTSLLDYISLLAWECPRIPQEKLENVLGE